MNARESQDDNSMSPRLEGAIGALLVLFVIWEYVREGGDWNYPAGLVALGLSVVARAYARQAETHAQLAQTIASILVGVAGVLIVLGLFL